VTALGRGHPLSETYHSRVAQNQDFSVIVSDHHNRRGTGKTVLSLKLAAAMDRTEEGLTSEKVSLSPEELAAAYIDQPRGSALVLDEGGDRPHAAGDRCGCRPQPVPCRQHRHGWRLSHLLRIREGRHGRRTAPASQRSYQQHLPVPPLCRPVQPGPSWPRRGGGRADMSGAQ